MTAFEPYCNDKCGRPATCEVPVGMYDGDLVVEWLCDPCAETARVA